MRALYIIKSEKLHVPYDIVEVNKIEFGMYVGTTVINYSQCSLHKSELLEELSMDEEYQMFNAKNDRDVAETIIKKYYPIAEFKRY